MSAECVECPEFEELTEAMTQRTTGIVVLNGKIEAFTCSIKAPKALKIESKSFAASNALAPPTQRQRSSSLHAYKTPTHLNSTALPMSPYLLSGRLAGSTSNLSLAGSAPQMSPTFSAPQGRKRSCSLSISEPSSQRLLLNLVQTLNDSFPDYCFENTKISQFQPLDIRFVRSRVNSYLTDVSDTPLFLSKLWHSIDMVIDLQRCEVFSFLPGFDHPLNDGVLWSFFYFFFNKESMRLCYITCSAKRSVWASQHLPVTRVLCFDTRKPLLTIIGHHTY
jgi:hypothetical protein